MKDQESQNEAVEAALRRLAEAKLTRKSDADIISVYQIKKLPFSALAALLTGRSPQQVVGDLSQSLSLDEIEHIITVLFTSMQSVHGELLHAATILRTMEGGQDGKER